MIDQYLSKAHVYLSCAYRARNDHRRRSECQQRAGRLGGDGSKSLLLAIALAVSHVGNTAKDKAHAHHKQAVGQDGTNHGGLDNFVLAIAQRNDANLESHKQSQHRARSQRRRTEYHLQSARPHFQTWRSADHPEPRPTWPRFPQSQKTVQRRAE